jgi:hypothetical protein
VRIIEDDDRRPARIEHLSEEHPSLIRLLPRLLTIEALEVLEVLALERIEQLRGTPEQLHRASGEVEREAGLDETFRRLQDALLRTVDPTLELGAMDTVDLPTQITQVATSSGPRSDRRRHRTT